MSSLNLYSKPRWYILKSLPLQGHPEASLVTALTELSRLLVCTVGTELLNIIYVNFRLQTAKCLIHKEKARIRKRNERKKESDYVKSIWERYNEVCALCFVDHKLRHMRDVVLQVRGIYDKDASRFWVFLF
jgi:hypothetical protein